MQCITNATATLAIHARSMRLVDKNVPRIPMGRMPLKHLYEVWQCAYGTIHTVHALERQKYIVVRAQIRKNAVEVSRIIVPKCDTRLCARLAHAIVHTRMNELVVYNHVAWLGYSRKQGDIGIKTRVAQEGSRRMKVSGKLVFKLGMRRGIAI